MIILKIAEALNRKDERGFTLIELLIVIAILAILAAIAIPLVTSRVQEARNAADIANVRSLQGAVDLWQIDNPTGTLDAGFQSTLENGGYLKGEVTSPHGTGYGYSVETKTVTTTDGKTRTVYIVKSTEPTPP